METYDDSKFYADTTHSYFKDIFQVSQRHLIIPIINIKLEGRYVNFAYLVLNDVKRFEWSYLHDARWLGGSRQLEGVVDPFTEYQDYFGWCLDRSGYDYHFKARHREAYFVIPNTSLKREESWRPTNTVTGSINTDATKVEQFLMYKNVPELVHKIWAAKSHAITRFELELVRNCN